MQDALRMVEDLPEQFKPVDCPTLDPLSYRGVLFSGMGGSGIVGDFACLFLERQGYKGMLYSHRGYGLPSFVEDGWLVVCTSYSGNTEETISSLEEALRRGLKPVCISSGGRLKEIAQKEGLLHLSLPQGFPPRYALGFMLSALMSLLNMKEEIEKIREHLLSKREEVKAKAKELAQGFYQYVPVVYATPLTQAVAFRWKTQINENAKTLCYNAFLPEMHHNEVVGLDNPITRSLCSFVLLYDEEDHQRVLRRVDITQEVFKELGVVLLTLRGEGSSLYERLMHLTYLGDYLSLYLAELYGMDPLPVKVIDFIKRSLSHG